MRLFLVFVALALATGARAADEPLPPMAYWTCPVVRAYVAEHGEAAARAKAKELHLPAWLIKRAESCK